MADKLIYREPWPSSIFIQVPVTHSEEGETKKRSVESICSGWQILLRGKDWLMSPILSSMPSSISDEKHPGAMALTLMLLRAHSTDKDSVILTIANLVVE